MDAGWLLQIPLFQHYVLSHNEPMGGHLFELRQYAAYMLVGVDKNNDDGQLASGVYQMAGLYSLPPEETRDRMQHARCKNIFGVQMIEDRQV